MKHFCFWKKKSKLLNFRSDEGLMLKMSAFELVMVANFCYQPRQ